jgi:hypothetical protein
MNKEKALEYISDKQYENVPKEFYKDKSFVLEAVKTNEFALQYADESLQKDPDIIKAAKK